jgi:serine/threonine protein kinase
MPQEKAKQLYQFLIYTTIFCLKKVPIVGAAVELAVDWQNNVKVQLNQQANLKVQERLAQIEQAMLCLPDEVRKMAREMIAEQRRLGVDISPEKEEAVVDLASAMPAAIRERTQATLRQARQHGTALHTVIPVGEQVSTQERAEFYQSLLPARRSAFRENAWVPHRNPPWQLVQLLGAGGFGEVWEARHPQLNNRFAVKFCQDEASAKVLKQEAAALFRLQKELPEHPNIVRLLDLQLDKEPYWLAFEYVPGGTLEALMRGASLTWQEALAIFLPIVEGMSAVHKVGIVHRDLKPANILLTEAGVSKITDFGIGKVMEEQERTRLLLSRSLTMAGFGSAGYASPEQIRGLPAHPADDTYALGALLWQLVTHTLQPPQYVQRSLREVKIPEAVKTLIIDCLENPREERPQRAEELLKVLQSLLFVTHEKARRKADEEEGLARFKAEEEAKQARLKAEEKEKRVSDRLDDIYAKLARRKAEGDASLAKHLAEKAEQARREAEKEAEQARRKAEKEAEQARRKAEKEAEQARRKAEKEAEEAKKWAAEKEKIAPTIKKLSPFNPLDWWRLLVWVLWSPQHLKVHREIFGQQYVGSWLVNTLIYLPWFLPALGLALGWLQPNVGSGYWPAVSMIGIAWLLRNGLCLSMYKYEDEKYVAEEIGMAIFMATLVVIGVAEGITEGMAIGVTAGTGGVLALVLATTVFNEMVIAMMTFTVMTMFITGVVRTFVAGVIAGAVAVAIAIAAGVVAGVMASVKKVVEDSLETGEPSIIARIAFIALLLSHAFILFYSLLGGWRFFS